MKCGKIRNLFEDEWAGILNADSKARLESHLSECDSCRKAREDLNRLWADLSEIPDEEPGPAMRPRFYSMLQSYRHDMEISATAISLRTRATEYFGKAIGFQPALQVGLAAMLLLAGFLGGYFLKSSRNGLEEIANLREEVLEMRQMVTISLLKQQSASERLKGVSWSNRVSRPDPEFLSTLMQTLNYDPNVDVRLASIDALARFASNQDVREGLIRALTKQDSPLVQISLIDLLVELQERQSIDILKQIVDDTGLNQQVRERAEWGMQRLVKGTAI